MLAAPPEPDLLFQCLKATRHVALAVSGGSDSMALLRLVADWASRQAEPPQLTVLTVDHGLRPHSSEEARQVADWSLALGLEHHVLVWHGSKPSTGLQSKARTARYGLMAEWCEAHGADVLLTAHTRDDQAETVLMRLQRTLSPASLSGIPVLGQWNATAVLRPLLDTSRQVLRSYLTSLGQAWIDDPSNSDSRFERVRVRNQLLDLVPQGVTADRLARLGGACAHADTLLERCSSQWLSLWLKEDKAGICYAPQSELLSLPLALQQRILSRIVGHYGGGRLKPELSELARLCHWLGGGGAPRCTLAGAVVGKRKSEFWVTREAARIDAAPLTICGDEEVLWDGRFAVAAPEGSTIIPAGDAAAASDRPVPIHARRAYPRVLLPEHAKGLVKVRFLQLSRP